MLRIALGGFQHETNTFARSKARIEGAGGLMATPGDVFGYA
jgi:microcystin degradation protein MlrC